MATSSQLDASRRSSAQRLILLLIASFFLAPFASVEAQELSSDEVRFGAAQQAFDSEHWEEAVRLATGPANQLAKLDFVRGLALARLERWQDSRLAFEAGHRKAPEDSRFLVELAGVAYRQKEFSEAKRELHAALQLNAHDAYTKEFLGTLYFLDGNLEAALTYWNPLDKPRLRNVSILPNPSLRPGLMQRTVTFHAPQILSRDALLATESRLDSLEIFPQKRIELAPSDAGTYDATLYLAERNGWGNSWIAGILNIFSGLPYETVYPEFYNLNHAAVNFTSLGRWDEEKHRIFVSLTLLVRDDPSLRLQFYVDVRNENWNLSETFFGSGTPLTDLNLRRVANGIEFRSAVNGNWGWSAGLEFSNRSFRNLEGHGTGNERAFFTKTNALVSWARFHRSILRIPEHRFALDGDVEEQFGRNFATGLGTFATLKGALRAEWFPQPKGDDYEMRAQIRTGGTIGKTTLDDLFQLGIERDNDLWLRGHRGTNDGRKGAAPLGRRYFLANWEMDKNVYKAGFLTIKLGPFLDSGAVADSSTLFGSRQWLWDVGVQCKIRVLNAVTVVLSYGRDLRGGRNVFYPTVLR